MFLLTVTLSAQNQNAKSPPNGIPLPEKDKAELLTAGRKLQAEVEALKKPGALAREVADYVPDVEIFSKAVLWAVELNEVYNVKQVADARNLLKVGNERLAALKSGQTPGGPRRDRSYAGIARRSTAPSSRMAWLFRRTGRSKGGGWTSGCMAGATS